MRSSASTMITKLRPVPTQLANPPTFSRCFSAGSGAQFLSWTHELPLTPFKGYIYRDKYALFAARYRLAVSCGNHFFHDGLPLPEFDRYRVKDVLNKSMCVKFKVVECSELIGLFTSYATRPCPYSPLSRFGLMAGMMAASGAGLYLTNSNRRILLIVTTLSR